MTSTRRYSRTALMGLNLLMGAGLVLGLTAPDANDRDWSPREYSKSHLDKIKADHLRAADEMIAAQVKDLGCTPNQKPNAIPDQVAVRNARAKDFDTGVVRLLDFDTAWTQAEAGKVKVEGFCY